MKYIISLAIFFISFITNNIIITLLSYFDLFNSDIINIIVILISIISSGIYLGLNSNKKGYLEGLKLGGIIILILTTITLIIKSITFNKYTILYYLILLFGEIISSTIGIYIKRKKS